MYFWKTAILNLNISKFVLLILKTSVYLSVHNTTEEEMINKAKFERIHDVDMQG